MTVAQKGLVGHLSTTYLVKLDSGLLAGLFAQVEASTMPATDRLAVSASIVLPGSKAVVKLKPGSRYDWSSRMQAHSMRGKTSGPPPHN